MLVLSRRIQESVHLGDSIVVQVLSVKGDRVQLGFSAPREIGIWRSELTSPSSSQCTADAMTPRANLERSDAPVNKHSIKLDAMTVSARRQAS